MQVAHMPDGKSATVYWDRRMYTRTLDFFWLFCAVIPFCQIPVAPFLPVLCMDRLFFGIVCAVCHVTR